MSNGSSSNGMGWLIGLGAIALLFVVQAIINAITMLVSALVNLLYIAGILAIIAGIGYAVYWFFIRPNTVQGRRVLEIEALLHHEQTLTVIQQCSELERSILLSPDMLDADKKMLRLRVEGLRADVRNKNIPAIELELKVKQLEILTKSRYISPKNDDHSLNTKSTKPESDYFANVNNTEPEKNYFDYIDDTKTKKSYSANIDDTKLKESFFDHVDDTEYRKSFFDRFANNKTPKKDDNSFTSFEEYQG